MVAALRAGVLTTAGLLFFSQPAPAHHSGAMFDEQKSLTLVGTVKVFQWTNPHCWIQLLVPSEQGTTEWSVELGPPSVVYKGGWKPSTVKPGTKLSIVIHPMRDGSNAGLFVSATGPDGTPFGQPASASPVASPPVG